jgi:alpha-tubulin suppressor-like RCC1 family protein
LNDEYTFQGAVYAFGCGFFGQLGLGHNKKSSVPVRVNTLPEKMAIIGTRYFHNVR